MLGPSLGRQRPERLLPAGPLPCRGNNATLACGRVKTTCRGDQLCGQSPSVGQGPAKPSGDSFPTHNYGACVHELSQRARKAPQTRATANATVRSR